MATKEQEATQVDKLLKRLADQVSKTGRGEITVSMAEMPQLIKEAIEKKTQQGIKMLGFTFKVTLPSIPKVAYDDSLGIPTAAFSGTAHVEGLSVNENIDISASIANSETIPTELETLHYSVTPSKVKGKDLMAMAGEFIGGPAINKTLTDHVGERVGEFGARLSEVEYSISAEGFKLVASGGKK